MLPGRERAVLAPKKDPAASHRHVVLAAEVPCLVLLSDTLGEMTFALEGETAEIGRSPRCEIVLRDDRVADIHARVIRRAGRWIIRDLGEPGGTRVNGEPIEERALAPMDRIEIAGAATLFFMDRQIGGRPAPAPIQGPP